MSKELVGALNEIAGTSGLEAAGAANAATIRLAAIERFAYKPTAASYESFSRLQANSSGALTSGTMRMTAIWLPSGATITSISVFSGGTALGTGTNQWFALYDSSLNLLRQTANDTSTAWAGNTKKTLALTSTFTTTYTGLHYIGVLVTAGTPPSVAAMISGSSALLLDAPALGGISSAGLTTTAPNPAGALTATSMTIYAYVS